METPTEIEMNRLCIEVAFRYLPFNGSYDCRFGPSCCKFGLLFHTPIFVWSLLGLSFDYRLVRSWDCGFTLASIYDGSWFCRFTLGTVHDGIRGTPFQEAFC